MVDGWVDELTRNLPARGEQLNALHDVANSGIIKENCWVLWATDVATACSKGHANHICPKTGHSHSHQVVDIAKYLLSERGVSIDTHMCPRATSTGSSVTVLRYNSASQLVERVAQELTSLAVRHHLTDIDIKIEVTNLSDVNVVTLSR